MGKYTEAQIQEGWYGYDPNFAANIVGTILFGIVLLFQIGLGLWSRQWWFGTTWVCTGILETLGYIARTVAHNDIFNFDMYKIQLVTLIIGPAFMSAGIYYQLAKVITVYGERFSPLAPMTYSAIFIVCDVISIFVQGAGGGVAADLNAETSRIGAWIMVGGIAFQVASISVFILLMTVVTVKIYLAGKRSSQAYNPDFEHIRGRRLFKLMIPCMFISTMFIFIRSVYRVVELAQGWHGHLINTERYFLILDGLMIFLGMVPFTVFHPGICLGKETIAVRGLHYKKNATPAAYDAAYDQSMSIGEPVISYQTNATGLQSQQSGMVPRKIFTGSFDDRESSLLPRYEVTEDYVPILKDKHDN